MEYDRAVSRALHEEHMAVLTLLGRLDQLVTLNSDANAPDCTKSDTHMLLGDLKAAVRGEITAHFAFEEDALFPILEEAGAADVNGMLHDEHVVLLPLGNELADLAEAASSGGFSADGWARFRKASREFVDGLRDHVDKEEAGLVPMVEDILSDDQDSELIQAYKF